MKKLNIVIASVFLSLPVVAAAEGGYQWEKQMEKKSTNAQHIGQSAAAKMGHSAVEHKRWTVDDNVTLLEEKRYPKMTRHHVPPHTDHMAADHKREMVGSNN